MFIDFHENLLFSSLKGFNEELAQWLIKYNTSIPHHSIELLSPIQWLNKYHPECRIYWTKTRS